ncbi:hypothetical protein L1049_024923 [Liquidambar formosana]|uniref:Sulfotransferase n=1 Tax=Liquidambar formosana TaxID=63359 RepID=A0AAP0S291_LIQFO
MRHCPVPFRIPTVELCTCVGILSTSSSLTGISATSYDTTTWNHTSSLSTMASSCIFGESTALGPSGITRWGFGRRAWRDRESVVFEIRGYERRHRVAGEEISGVLGVSFFCGGEKEGVIQEISRLCSFESMKDLEANKSGRGPVGVPNSSFFRKGKVGDWGNYLTPSMAERMEKLVEEKFGGSGLTFKLSVLPPPKG